jgi:hypothetical protein
MRKYTLAVPLALAVCLGGCATFDKLETAFQTVTGKVVSPQAVVVAINAFDASEALATSYVRLPLCGTGPVVCRTQAVTTKVVTFVRAGRADRNQLKAALRLNPGANISLVDVYNDLGNTTAALSAALASK